MNLIAVTKDSFQEYAGYQSLVLFCSRCNLKCEYCYNREQILHGKIIGEAKEILDKELNPMHDAVVFLGGEPTMWDDLPALCKYVKEVKGKRVKLFTNGLRPSVVKKCLPWLDAVSVDYKCYTDSSVLGVNMSIEYYKTVVEETINLQNQKEDVKFEIRTTNFDNMNEDELFSLEAAVNKFGCQHIIQQDFRKYLEGANKNE